jgi:hypothetical protein
MAIFKFYLDDFEWFSDGGLIEGRERLDCWGYDQQGNPVVVNMNVENFDMVCQNLAANKHVVVECPDEVAHLICTPL